ncbi:WD40 repeat domain-containing protein, partial [bacterium]|nr:WD40 repeat domain-containing protein [bacterium]
PSLGSIRDHKGAVLSVAFHPTAPILATGSQDNEAKLWRLSDDNQLSDMLLTAKHDDQIRSVAFHPTEIILATGSYDGTAKLWQPSTDSLSLRCVATLQGHKGAVHSVAFHRSGEFLATGSQDYTVKLWQLSHDRSSASCVATLDGHTDAVLSVAFHPSDEFLATGSADKTVKLWRLLPDRSSANCVATLDGHDGYVTSVAFHPSGNFLATGSYNTVILRKISKSDDPDSLSVTLVGTESSAGAVGTVAFHPLGEFLATGSLDNTVKLWKLSSNDGSPSMSSVAILKMPVPDQSAETKKESPPPRILSVAFHPTKPILAAGSSDHTATLWDYSIAQKGGRGRKSITRHHKKRSSRKVKRRVSKTKRYRSK